MIKSEFTTNEGLRRDLYAGEVFLLESVKESTELVNGVKSLLIDSLGKDYRDSRHSLDAEDFFQKISHLRKEIYLDKSFQELVGDLIVSHGFDAEQCLIDPARLRVISHDGHLNPKAKPVYYAHRDTWYSHPQSLITWWVPIDDLATEETFEFFPDYFQKEVPNNSEIFNYEDWVKDGWDLKIGWQKMNDGVEAKFPSLTGEFDRTNATGFSCRTGQNLLFSGAQFHQTKPQSLNRTRFSLDFRLVVKSDMVNNAEAPNVDNRSKGSTIKDYFSIV